MAAISSMRLLVVGASPPASSFSTLRKRKTAPHPPGPGLPLHAPSVKISTAGPARDGLSDVDAISGRPGDAAVKAQPFEIFERILGAHQGARGLVQPVVEPGQQESQRTAARQERQCRELSGPER